MAEEEAVGKLPRPGEPGTVSAAILANVRA